MKRLTKSEKSMLDSCYTYGFMNYSNQYIKPIVDRVGRELVEKYEAKLRKYYTVSYNVYEDSEGCTYNSLIKAN